MLRKRARLRSLDVPLPARNRALDYLANRRHTLSDDLRYQLTEVVNSYVGRCDEDAARAGHCGRTKLCQKRCEQSQQKGKLFDHLVAL